ncbi:neuropeptide CCHamide-1 receptor-like [Homarus americanus]|uniref:Neuropeptide CCHamide-1 receptor-like 2 n=1 Tax=Homarus americanus TaxID=6706 RepID=A0A8J5JSG4_HOMAM|nr:neuropeptide CCHamide-1 receptor-like [Homarus americanus]KAG7161606.1 Neuropeptide CCHamide-1 receptor-like 2 [Homarus americanus]
MAMLEEGCVGSGVECDLTDSTLEATVEDPSTNLSWINNSLLAVTTELPYIPMQERPETYIVPIVFFIIFVVGVAGNGTLVFMFIKYPTMRNVPNTYILSLALGDLLVVIFAVPFVSLIYVTDHWPFGEFICRLSEFMRDISVGVTVFTLTALSADRYMAIVDPVGKRAGAVAHRSTVAVTVMIWVLAAILATPAGVFSHLSVKDSSKGDIVVCYPFPPWLGMSYRKINVLAKVTVYYVLPLLIISTFYLLMARHLVKAAEPLPGEAQHQRHHIKHVAARRKVAKLVLAFVVIFAICYFPNHVFLLWFYFNPNMKEDYNYFWNAFRCVGFCLGFINSCINPIALYCISGTFRKNFNRHLFCCICPEATQGRTWTTFHFHSSGQHFISTVRKTENFDMSTMNGPEKTAV